MIYPIRQIRLRVDPLRVKVARRYQVTIPEDVREKAKISVGDHLEVVCEDGKILLEKLEDNWEKVMAETEGSWAKHPVFGEMKNSVEIVQWLRSPHRGPEDFKNYLKIDVTTPTDLMRKSP